MKGASTGARVLFAGHLGLIAFSTLAMMTILNGPPQPWLTQEPHATAMRLGWRYSGQTYVTLGALAALFHAARALGWGRALGLMATASLITLGAELLGTSAGLPFGEYHYSDLLGYRIGGLVPYPIPISWFYMLYACLAICGRVLGVEDTNRGKWKWAAVAALLLMAWDVSMDPAMVQTAHWVWGSGQQFRDAGLPAWLVSYFTRDVFYGMPLSNWGGWFLTGLVVARVMLWIVPPTSFRDSVSPALLPLALYLANGIMPVALSFRDGMLWAGVLGAILMVVPVAVALLRPRTIHARVAGQPERA